MCTHQTKIRNRYLHYPLWVNCGKCESCLEEKASRRTFKIRNEARCKNDIICLFVNLDYNNKYVPYLDYNQLIDYSMGLTSVLDVHRDYDVHLKKKVKSYHRKKVRGKGYCKRKIPYINNRGTKDFSYKRIDYVRESPLMSYMSEDLSEDAQFLIDNSLDQFQFIRKKVNGQWTTIKDKVAVLCYKDLQDFFKRLRKNLKKRYNYDKRISYFACGEYGADFGRCHWHILLFCRREDEQLIRLAISQNWLFSSFYHTSRGIEFVRGDAASYVSQYVNCHSDIPLFFKSDKKVRPMWHYSQRFGVGFYKFQLQEILKMFDKRDFTYIENFYDGSGFTSKRLPIPSYVLSRYVTKFKGYSRLPLDTLRGVINSACFDDEETFTNKFRGEIDFIHKNNNLNLVFNSEFDYKPEDFHSIYVLIRNKYELFKPYIGEQDIYRFVDIYSTAWNIRFSNQLRIVLSEVVDPLDYYSNCDVFRVRQAIRQWRINLGLPYKEVSKSPNEQQSTISDTLDNVARFNENIKRRKISADSYINNNQLFYYG